MRLLRTCHALAMLLWWLGFVSFAWYLLAPFQGEAGTGIVANMVRPFQRTAPGVVNQIFYDSIKETEKSHTQYVLSLDWLTWYHSPLNLHHWGIAMLCCAPALGMTFLVRHLTWRRQHE